MKNETLGMMKSTCVRIPTVALMSAQSVHVACPHRYGTVIRGRETFATVRYHRPRERNLCNSSTVTEPAECGQQSVPCTVLPSRWYFLPRERKEPPPRQPD